MLTIDECWELLEAVVAKQSEEESLAPPAAVDKRDEIEQLLGAKLPDDVRRVYLRHDGSGKYSIAPYKIGGGNQAFMRLQDAQRLWRDQVAIATETEPADLGRQKGPVQSGYWRKL